MIQIYFEIKNCTYEWSQIPPKTMDYQSLSLFDIGNQRK